MNTAQRRPFNDWLSRVDAELRDDADPDTYRVYWQAGLTPAEAVAAERAEYLEAA